MARLAALLTCIRRQFMTESVSEVRPSSAFPSASTTRRQKFVPANIDLTNPTRLLTLLLAVAKIRSRNGTTPNDVVELLIAFAAHADDREPHTVQNKFSSRMDTVTTRRYYCSPCRRSVLSLSKETPWGTGSDLINRWKLHPEAVPFHCNE